jgi:hypothetical protein
VALLGLALALAATGCGSAAGTDEIATAGGPRTGVPTTTAPSAQDMQSKLLAFSQCMRDNGIPDFPDPQFSDGGGVSLSIPEGTDRAKVDAAHEKCQQYLPNGGEPGRADPEALERMRKFAECMRDNGFPDFPDPTDEGLQINGDEHPDLNPDNPAFVAAEKTCQQYAPGPPGEGPRTESRTG